jgi:hypothetical protein
MKGNSYVPFMLRRGDGSTLSLDFTAGVLDPRLTFTRTTNATFINSQGYVEWANSNMYYNTAFEGLSGSNPSLTSSGWAYALSTGGTAVFNGDGTVTVTTTAAERRAIFRSPGFSGGGLRVVASVDVTIASGSLEASQVIVTGTPTNAQHYVNGVIWNSSHPIWNGGILPVGTQFNIAYATDSQTSGTTSMYFGVGCTTVIAGSATFSNPRWTMWKGSATVPYYPNTSATNNSTTNYFKSNDYQAPRFDYDPTTLTPRGLLIEGSATNLVTNSQNITTGTWTVGGNTTLTANTTEVTDPAGGNTATKIALAAGVYCSRAQLVTVLANTAYTFSFWIRGTAGSQQRVFEYEGSDLVSQTTLTYTNTGWTRVRVQFTSATKTTIFVYVCSKSTSAGSSDVLYVWGGQLELGSGASSYIPTGTSTVQRAIDICTMSNIAAINYNANGGTLFAHFSNNTENGNFAGSIAFNNGGNYAQRFRWGSGVLLVTYFQTNGTSALGSNLNGSRTSLGSAKAATSYSFDGTTTSTAMSINGAQATTTPTSSATSGVSIATALRLNSDNSSAGTDYPSIAIRSIKFWPTGLTMAQMNALTVNP